VDGPGEPALDLIVARESPYFVEADGPRILDLSSEWATTQLGHGYPVGPEAIREQLEKLRQVKLISDGQGAR
jgi:adenosylmethionine-8-amino-7-oxononanoate aminotransferase